MQRVSLVCNWLMITTDPDAAIVTIVPQSERVSCCKLEATGSVLDTNCLNRQPLCVRTGSLVERIRAIWCVAAWVCAGPPARLRDTEHSHNTQNIFSATYTINCRNRWRPG